MAATNIIKPQIKRLRFSYNDDLILLRQVLATNPFENGKWGEVSQILKSVTGRGFSTRSTKERVDLLLRYYIKEDRANLRKSGTEEQFLEKEQLLQEIKEIAEEARNNPRTKRKMSDEESRRIGMAARDEACYNFVSVELNDVDDWPYEDDDILVNSTSVSDTSGLGDAQVDSSGQSQPSGSQDQPESSTSSSQNMPPPPRPQPRSSSFLAEDSAPSSTPVRRGKSKLRGDSIDYLRLKEANRASFKERELENEKKRLKIEEDKILLENRRLDIEEKKMELLELEKKALLESSAKKDEMISKLLEKLLK